MSYRVLGKFHSCPFKLPDRRMVANDSEIKVLMVTAAASPQSGATYQLLHMADLVKKSGIVPEVALPYLPEGLPEQPIRQVALIPPRLAGGLGHHIRYIVMFLPSVLSLRRIILSDRVDIVHANEILDLQAALAARLSGIGLVWHVRADFRSLPCLSRLLGQLSVRLAHRVLVVSESVQRNIYVRYNTPTSKVKVIYESCRFSGPLPEYDVPAVRSRLGLTPDAPVIGLVSKLQHLKGHRWLIHATPIVLQSYPDAKVLLVGGPVKGHEEDAEALCRLVQETGLNGHVLFTGTVNNVAEIMAACDVMVHCPEYDDPFPGVVLEAMFIAKPIVATSVGGIVEQVVDGTTGLLVPAGDAEALALAILRLLGDVQLRQRMGLAGRERVLSQFSAEQYGRKLAEIYREVLGERNSQYCGSSPMQ